MKKRVDEGVVARSELTNLTEELQTRQRTIELAQSRAKLLEELSNMATVEARYADADQPQLPEHHTLAERYDGNGSFRDADFRKVASAFQKQFGKPLPVSAKGETALHRSLGFDHRGRVDVALNPDQKEGSWLRKFLMTQH